MARKWGANRKRAAGGRRRRRSREEEEEDDEYIAEEEEEEEEESVKSEDSDDEESFEFSDDTSSDESDEVAAPKRRRSGGGVRKKQRKMGRVSDKDEAGESRVNRSRRRSSASGPVDDEGDDDEDFLPDEEDDEEEMMSKGNQRGRKRNAKASKGNVRKREKPAVAVPVRRTHRVEEDPADKKKRRRKRRGSSDSESSDSDFVASGDDSLGMDVSDPVFVALDDEEFAVRDRGRVVKDGPKKKRSVRRNNRRLLNSDMLSFNCVIREKDANDAGNGANTDVPKRGNGKEKEKSLMMDSETSDSDYVVSDDEIGAMSGSGYDFDISDDNFIVRDRNRAVIDEPRKKSKAARENDRIHRPRNKRRLSNSNALSFDRVIQEEDSRHVAIGDTPDVSQLKSEDKGKEKAADVFEKQVCGICLSEEHEETVQGVLDCCPHYFCFTCIMDWSKVESKCPVCKRRFKTICRTTRSDPWFGFRNAVVNVPKRDQVYQPTVEEIRSLIDPYENVVCMVCQQGCHDNLMLLCDICDSPAHTYCVGLEGEIPEGNWYCDGCRTVDDGSPNPQVLCTAINQGTSSNNMFSSALETEDLGTSMHGSTSSQQLTPLPGQTSSQIFDLNVSPRHLPVEDHGVASLAIFTRQSTLSGSHTPEQLRRLPDTRPRQTEISFSGSSSSQVKDALLNQETGNNDLSSGGRETQNLSSNMHGNASRSAIPLSGRSAQNIDLNVSPRNLSGEDHGVVSQASGSGASTLSGRRAMHRIHMLLSDSRLRELFHRTYVPSRNVERM